MSNIYWQLADGSAPAERLSSSENTQNPSSWSPDGKVLAYDEEAPETARDIWVASPQENKDPQPFLKTGFDEGNPSFSPNGRWLAYDSDESGRPEVYVRSFPEVAAKQQISTGGGFAVWSRDGTEIFYQSGDKVMAVDVHPADMRLGKPRLLFELENAYSSFDVSLDGRFLMTIGSEPSITHLTLVQNWFQELERLVPTDN